MVTWGCGRTRGLWWCATGRLRDDTCCRGLRGRETLRGRVGLWSRDLHDWGLFDGGPGFLLVGWWRASLPRSLQLKRKGINEVLGLDGW